MVLTRKNTNFKTSYVEVYRYLYFLYFWTGHISKHLMLKFIAITIIVSSVMFYFKTSYVEVYPSLSALCTETHLHFKTSYVEVYRKAHS